MDVDPNKNEVRILRTGAKPRFTKSEYDEINGQTFSKMVEKILGGDTRSTMLKSGLPNFSEEL